MIHITVTSPNHLSVCCTARVRYGIDDKLEVVRVCEYCGRTLSKVDAKKPENEIEKMLTDF